MTDSYWMRRALVLARRGWGTTSPNPLVGVVVLDAEGKLAGTGFHSKAGGPHAEVFALETAGSKARGGTLYVTMEPCCSFEGKRTPPCTDLIIRSGVKRVVVASLDPNPLVHRNGIAKLRQAGLDVSVGCLAEVSNFLNTPYCSSVLKKRPLVTAKVAVTEDGKIGIRGKRLYLSGKECFRRTMHLRAQAGGIVVGSSTILNDDPLLTVRGRFKDRKPIRTILDPDLETPPSAKVLNSDGGEVWIFTSKDHSKNPVCEELERRRARIIPVSTQRDGTLSLEEILKSFTEHGVNALLVEGGAETFSGFARAGLIDRWIVYRTPLHLGRTFESLPTVAFDPVTAFALAPSYVIRRGADSEFVAEPTNA